MDILRKRHFNLYILAGSVVTMGIIIGQMYVTRGHEFVKMCEQQKLDLATYRARRGAMVVGCVMVGILLLLTCLSLIPSATENVMNDILLVVALAFAVVSAVAAIQTDLLLDSVIARNIGLTDVINDPKLSFTLDVGGLIPVFGLYISLVFLVPLVQYVTRSRRVMDITRHNVIYTMPWAIIMYAQILVFQHFRNLTDDTFCGKSPLPEHHFLKWSSVSLAVFCGLFTGLSLVMSLVR